MSVLGRTQWSSLLDLTTYLYYFTSGCVPIITQSHVLSECSMITWPCHVIWLPNFPCYLYLDPVIWLDVRDQMFEYIGNSFLSGALITLWWVLWYFKEFKNAKLDKWQKMLLSLRSNPQTMSPYIQKSDGLCTRTEHYMLLPIVLHIVVLLC